MREDLTIGALSKRAGVKVETIRYYERIGLVPAPPRSAGGQRLYAADHGRRLAFIRRSRELGFTLHEIRTLLGLVDGGASCSEVRAVALAHLERIRARLADLRRMEGILADTAARCEGGMVPECPILDALLDGAVTEPGGSAGRA